MDVACKITGLECTTGKMASRQDRSINRLWVVPRVLVGDCKTHSWGNVWDKIQLMA